MLEKYYSINQAAGVSIQLQQDGSTIIHACSITVDGKQLSFKKKVPDLSSPETLTKHFPEKTFIAINLSGKGILQKQLPKTEEINQQNFSQVLPNAKPEDFYIQNFISGEYSFVSVIRKSEADKYISRLTGFGFVPLILSLGPFPVQHIAEQLNVNSSDIVFDGYTIQRNEKGDWLSVRYDQESISPYPLKIESEPLDEMLVIPYAAAFQLLLSGKLSMINAEVPDLAIVLQKVQTNKKFKVQGFLILTAVFVLLLVNFMLFSWLNSTNSRLTEQVSMTTQNSGDIQKTDQQVAQKDSLTKLLGWEGNIYKSVLIDQVASLLPEDITWNSVSVDPIDFTSSRNQKNIMFSTKKIRITGQSEKIIPVNEWIARIKTMPWVKNVQLDSYTFNSEINTGQFTILIDY